MDSEGLLAPLIGGKGFGSLAELVLAGHEALIELLDQIVHAQASLIPIGGGAPISSNLQQLTDHLHMLEERRAQPFTHREGPGFLIIAKERAVIEIDHSDGFLFIILLDRNPSLEGPDIHPAELGIHCEFAFSQNHRVRMAEEFSEPLQCHRKRGRCRIAIGLRPEGFDEARLIDIPPAQRNQSFQEVERAFLRLPGERNGLAILHQGKPA